MGAFAIGYLDTNDHGPDNMELWFNKLEPITVYTVYLSATPTANSVPVSFLGEFTSKKDGTAKFRVRCELASAFIGLNLMEDYDSDGRIIGKAAGELQSHPLRIPTPYVQVYRAESQEVRPAKTIYGVGPAKAGGPIAMFSGRL
jgi:hypothetical protein